MVKMEIDPVLANGLGVRGLESIIALFEREMPSFYALGRVYFEGQQEIEDAIYQSIIKVHEESYKRKKGQSATSAFLKYCQEMSNQSLSIGGNDTFKAFHHLETGVKEAVALVYVKGCSHEEAACVLEITVDEVKSRLFRGVRTLREKLGYDTGFKGCHDYQIHYLDYLGRTMNRPEKVDFEIHIYHCQHCQEDLASFQEVTLSLGGMAENIAVPSGFMERVRSRLYEREAKREKRKKKRKSIWLSIAGVFALLVCTGFVTGGFARLYYSYTEEDEQLRAFLQHDLGERLDLEAESNGVKITVKSVVADDVQTLVFYEIEDSKNDNRYMMNGYEGVYIENESEVMNMSADSRFYSPPIDQGEIHNEEKNVYKGTMSLMPVAVDKGTIKLNVARLMQLAHDGKEGLYGGGEMKFAEGEWNFEIPFEKQSSRVHKLDQEVEVGGIPVRLDKLTIAPTTTLLQYSFQIDRDEERIDVINFDSLEIDGKKMEADPFGGNMYMDSINQEGWNAFTASFDTLYFDDPKEVGIQFGSLHLSVDSRKTIELDATKDLPQNTEYLGNTISIDKISVGNPARVVLTHDLSKDRVYENVNYQFYRTPEDDQNISISINGGDGVLMDKDGKTHDVGAYVYDKLDHPRYFETEQTIDFYNDGSTEDVTPTELVIEGYSTTKYVDDKISISLDK
ncbi:DUF4179 domain-containing protein [Bacillus sp. BHET2]|uniref:DUF4179 domain-containing protein n=1 Tax=Bacillus sp. BHET2 TaxID=2583818 RepID=UPI00110D9C23|nr:DUF4179 domain-containing protein [Bacillus sp. BHET2]TMU85094.1 DUF4179 domain-containing protein [Bacillus sp. BHET2]